MSSTLAPSVSKIRLTLAFCSAKPIWIPRNPKLIFQISQKLSLGSGAGSPSPPGADSGPCRGRRMDWKLGLHSRHLAGRIRIACPPPGASTTCNRVADVTVRA